MKTVRKIIKIDEDKCNGCGQCILACAEEALVIENGKAKLVGELYCDGLGACLGECPTGALTIIEREADDFDEEAVQEMINNKEEQPQAGQPAKQTQPHGMAGGCPGSRMRSIEPADDAGGQTQRTSLLRQWPLKLQLLGPGAPYLQDADLVLLADCVAAAFPDLHNSILRNHVIAMGCPKLDDLDAHIERLATIIRGANLKSLTVAHMEVPCCRGFIYAAQEAIKKAGVECPLKTMQIGISGEVQS